MTTMKKLVLVMACMALSACSTIVHEKNQYVNITSNPPGATLKIDGRSFVTPASVSLKGKSEYYFTLEKEGYKTASGKVDGDFRIWSAVIGNIFNLTGVLGFAVDFWGTETAYELHKDNTVTLEPLPAAVMEIQPTLQQPLVPAAPVPPAPVR